MLVSWAAASRVPAGKPSSDEGRSDGAVPDRGPAGTAPGRPASRSAPPVRYELRPGARLGWEIEDLADALEGICGRPVDLIARTGLHPRLAATVLEQARPI